MEKFLQIITIGSNGTFSVPFNVPASATEGDHTIYFTDLDSRYFLVATFKVGSGSPLADLIPTAIRYSFAGLVPGKTVFFDSGIQNLGIQGTGVFNVRWFVDGVSVGYGSHAGVPANSTVLNGNSQYSWQAALGTHTISFVVDSDNHVLESNESNNTRSITVTVTPQSEISYFALGDSVASGHGLMDKDKVKDNDKDCRRSEHAYPYKVRDHLLERYNIVNFKHDLTCSGASVLEPDFDKLKKNNYKWFHNQVDEALKQIKKVPSSQPVLVSVTIGANDTNFGDLILFIIPKFIPQLAVSDDEFYTWLDKTAVSVKNTLSSEVRRLLAQKNVAIIITDYYNPFNTASWFFLAPDLAPFSTCLYGGCYPRTEAIIGRLNGVFLDIWKELNQLEQERLQVATVYGLFQNHQSPRLACGNDPPDTSNTLIQYPTDPESNAISDPRMIPDWLKNLSAVPIWTGDCFHPTEKGAQIYADAINDDAKRLGR